MRALVIKDSYPAPGRGSAGLAWDGRFLWLADYARARLFALDVTTGEVVRDLISPGTFSGLAWDGEALWQAMHYTGALRKYNPYTNDFDQTIMVDDKAWLAGLAWDGANLWVAAQKRGMLLAIDKDTGEQRQTLPGRVAAGGLAYRDSSLWLAFAHPMSFDEAAGSFRWEGAEPHYAIGQIDAATGEELARYPLEFLPMGLAWVDDSLWLSETAGQKVHRAVLE